MRKYLNIILFLGILSMFIISIGAVTAADIHVSKNGNIKEAVKKAKNGDTIYLKPGTYTGSSNKDITINKNIKISALPANIKKNNTIINAGKNSRVFSVVNKKLTVVGITFSNGKKDYGGAINVANGKLVVDNCKFTSNKATKYGGAIYSWKSTVNIKNSVFTSNLASISGGGISHFANKLTITGTSFNNNKASSYGGGLHTTDGSHAVITSSRWISNTGYGGGICNFGTMDLKNSVFKSNKSPKNAGGIAVEDDATITNCTFDSNIAEERGGGIHNAGKTIVKSSTFINNEGKSKFGGAMDTHAPFKIYNSVIKNNKAAYGAAITVYRFKGPQEKYTYGKDVLVQNCVIQDNIGTKSGWGWSIFVSYGSVPKDKRIASVKFVGNTWDTGVTNSLSGLTPHHLYKQDSNSKISVS